MTQERKNHLELQNWTSDNKMDKELGGSKLTPCIAVEVSC